MELYFTRGTMYFTRGTMYFIRGTMCHRNQMRGFSCDTLLHAATKQTFLVLSNFFTLPHFWTRVNWQHMQFVTRLAHFFTQLLLLPPSVSCSEFMQGVKWTVSIWISLMITFDQIRKKYSRALSTLLNLFQFLGFQFQLFSQWS